MKRTSVRHMGVRALIALAALAAVALPVHPAGKEQAARSGATLTTDSYRPFLINNIFNYYGNNGDGSYNPFSADEHGFEFPKDSQKWVLYEDGIVWGGFHKGRAVPKVGGSVYRHALQAGPLLSNGSMNTDPVPANPADPKYRVFRVRPDVRPDIPFAGVEALLTAEEVPSIDRYEAVSARDLYDRYVADWNDWPATHGAPFTDVDENGVYDPTVDIPGRPGADQTLWYVANDMDSTRTYYLAGCPPIGLEMQRTVWGYRRTGVLGNTIFTSTVLINKSGAPVDSMYIVQWADPDLGFAGDDFVGCDTTLGLGYVYNGVATDKSFGTAVPAAGFALLQGPMVQGTLADTATFLSTQRPGFTNLRMSAFAYFGSPFPDPVQGTYGDMQWSFLMRGKRPSSGTPFIDPNTNRSTVFCLSGDPVRGTDGSAGWVDGQGGHSPGDRRLVMITGPFTFADGDTQQVVVACLASQGADRISSIAVLRSDVRAVRSVYGEPSLTRRMPPMSCSVTRDSVQAAITFRVDARQDPIVSAVVDLTTYRDVPVAAVALADDGLHEDGNADDGVWAGMAIVSARHAGLRGGATLTFSGGQTLRWEHVCEHIVTAHLSVVSYAVASDNVNSDGVPNPGENLRYVFAVKNDSPLDLPRLVTTARAGSGHGQYTIGTLNSHALFQRQYDANDPASYFTFDVPPGYQDSTLRATVVTTDDSLNVWRDTLIFPVRPLPGKAYTTPLLHTGGKATGEFTIQIVDPARVKDHLYVLRGNEEGGEPGGYTLKDSTAGMVLLADHAPPDSLGHTSPVVDGFKVLRGTTAVTPGMERWSVPEGVLRFSPVGGYYGFGLEGFSDATDPDAYDAVRGTIGAAKNFRFSGIGTTLTIAGGHTVLLKLAEVNHQALWDPKSVPADTNFSRAYRYLRAADGDTVNPSFLPWIINKGSGHPYQDYNYAVPFSAWDMDANPPVRLAVGHLETNATGGLVDGRYWPGDATQYNRIARELAFIFRAPYTDTPDTALAVNLYNNSTTPLMWVLGCARRAEESWPGLDQFMIIAHHFPSSEDAWVFNPSVVADVPQADLPLRFALLQNYPNPFNPSTTIRYELPSQGMVTVTIFDVLGRAVRHLVREVQPAGSHAVLWHGDNDAGRSIASGVYFYRCTVEQSDRGGTIDQTMKMIVLR